MFIGVVVDAQQCGDASVDGAHLVHKHCLSALACLSVERCSYSSSTSPLELWEISFHHRIFCSLLQQHMESQPIVAQILFILSHGWCSSLLLTLSAGENLIVCVKLRWTSPLFTERYSQIESSLGDVLASVCSCFSDQPRLLSMAERILTRPRGEPSCTQDFTTQQQLFHNCFPTPPLFYSFDRLPDSLVWDELERRHCLILLFPPA